MKTSTLLLLSATALLLASCASPGDDVGHVVFESSSPSTYHSAVAGPRAREVALGKAERWAKTSGGAYATRSPRRGIALTSTLGPPRADGVIYLE